MWSAITVVSADHQSASEWLRSPLNAALFIFFIAASFWHTSLGLQVVIEDYIHTEWVKMTVLISVKLLIALFTVVATLLVLRIFLGA